MKQGTLVSVFLSLCVSIVAAKSNRGHLNDALKASNDSLYWGPYRPGVYFGIRNRAPESFMAGLMWANVDNYEKYGNLRHSCEQGDDMGSYGWEQFDARKGGKQVIRDKQMGLDITTEFVKLPGSHHGGNWAVRVKGTPKADAPPDLKTAMIFYAGLDGEGDTILEGTERKDATLGLEGTVRIRGKSEELGQFAVEVTDGPDAVNLHPDAEHEYAQVKDLQRTSFMSLIMEKGSLWQIKDALLSLLSQQLGQVQKQYKDLPEPWLLFALNNTCPIGSTTHLLQKVYEGAFEFDVIYRAWDDEVTSEDVTGGINDLKTTFDDKFSQVFKLQQPYNKPEYNKFGQVLFSNLLGGVGYFHGKSLVDRSYSEAYKEDEEMFWEAANAQLAASPGVEEGPSQLFTSVPSRAFFPRGFYWDEGFHLLPIGQYDTDLSLEIIKSWFDLIDEDGWIGREQILGEEARSRVPKEFQTQFPHYANPPTLFIAIDHFLEQLQAQTGGSEYTADFQQAINSDAKKKSDSLYLQNPALAKRYLRELYPNLKRHYDWFRRSQKGELKAYDREATSSKEAYRWRGRTPDHCLTSGIDDYPRARPPHPGELHVDLHSWVALMTKLLRNIADQVGESDDAAELAAIEKDILANLDDLYWSERDGAYCDQTIDAFEETAPVCHFGYISIFPVLLGLLPPDHIHLEAVLKLIRNEEHLWSPHGLRSLSAQDEYYGKGENYWRGPIWININYLLLSSLYRNYMHVKGPQQDLAIQIYTELRENVVNTVFDEWQKSGIIWEQYNPETGAGQRTKGFTGWTSLVVSIMAEQY